MMVRLHDDSLNIPELLVMQDGRPVRDVEDWTTGRRPEILELYRSHVYGRSPVDRPDSLTYDVVETRDDALGGSAVGRRIRIGYVGPGGQGAIDLTAFTPKAAAGPAPLFLLICNRAVEDLGLDRTELSPFWPVEEIVARGYATAAFQVADVDPDYFDDFQNGVHGIFDDPDAPRPPDAWGTIAAWAWGASRAIDYFEEAPDIDTTRVAIIGHSRGGKTALWCGAQDKRVALAISNSSGCTGAAIARRRMGETVADINTRFPHWFCGNYRQFNDREDDLPIDQHMLIALMAPRPVYIASATDDAWADPEGEFLGGIYAQPVYDLFDLPGLESAEMPPADTPVHDGRIGYHIRTGGHDLTEYDWRCYLDYANRWMG